MRDFELGPRFLKLNIPGGIINRSEGSEKVIKAKRREAVNASSIVSRNVQQMKTEERKSKEVEEKKQCGTMILLHRSKMAAEAGDLHLLDDLVFCPDVHLAVFHLQLLTLL